MEDWLQVTLISPSAAGEAVSDALFTAGAGGVWEDEPDQHGRLVYRAGFSSGQEMRLMAELPNALDRISRALELPLTDFELTLELKPGEDYAETWKKDLLPLVISPILIISPSWWTEPLPLSPEANVLKLDPGSAFGSGHHPTTFLCLTILCQLVERNLFFNKVLDLGSGSGILALAAALLLPKAKIIAIDNDPETLFAAKNNVELNQLSSRLKPEITTLESLEGEFELIMANLTRNTLTELAKDLAARSSLPGRLILSGLLAEQVPAVIKTFAPLGFLVERHLGQAEWSALSLVRGLPVTPNQEREIIPSGSPEPDAQDQDAQEHDSQAQGAGPKN
ncbi:MAG: 50S ribosomal protein L11 methyltransferase [Deltaproteobacteria bacterium]|jgi:ribosomal protein L11 methyltransferase|nr:50S ribosomal protein L11 methyltransferase [Deltaproteobacteria bacterium]